MSERFVYLAEGDTDTAMLAQAGLPVVGVRGVQGFKAEYVEKFAKITMIYVCADADEAGLALIERAGTLLGNRARIIELPSGEDVSSYIGEKGYDITTLTETAPPYLDWLMNRLPKTIDLNELDHFVGLFIPALRMMGEAVREGYVKRVAKRLGITVGPIREAIRAAGNGNGNGHGHGGIDATKIIWQDKPSINPSQDLVGDTMMTVVFLDKLITDELTNEQKVVTLPHVVTTRREVFELTDAEMFRRGYRYAPTKVPAYGVLGQRWRTGDYPHSVKNFIDGAVSVAPWDVYSEVVGYFRRHVWYPNPLYYDFLALWTIGTYFFNLFPAFPYVHLLATMRAGKTLTMDIIDELAFNAVKASSLTAAAAFRTVEMCSATLLHDEAENLVKRDKNDDADQDKLEIFKAGYKRGGKAIRCTGENHEPTAYDVYSPKIFGGTAAIDRILGDRTLPLTLARKGKEVDVLPFSATLHGPNLHLTRDKLYCLMLEQGREVTERLKEGIHWDGVTDRDLELWTPILILAAFFDDYYVEEVGSEVDAATLLTAKMRALAKDIAVERTALSRMEQVEVTILEGVMEFLGEATPVTGDWYATESLFTFLQARDELMWLKSIRKVYDELQKATAIRKSEHVARQRPSPGAKQVRCIWLNKQRIEAVAIRLGAIPEKVAL